MLLYGSNTNAHPSTPPNFTDCWDRVGTFIGGHVAAVLSKRHFAFVVHVGGNVGDVFTYKGVAYTTTARVVSGDVAIYTVGADMPVPDDADEIGALDRPSSENYEGLVMLSRTHPKAGTLEVSSVLRGWYVGTLEPTLRWGANRGQISGSFLSTRFASDQGDNNFAINSGDSGAPIFVRQKGQWRLLALAFGVTSLSFGTTTGNIAPACVFNQAGLYNQSSVLQSSTLGVQNVHHALTHPAYRDLIRSLVPRSISFNTPFLGTLPEVVPVS